MGTGAETRDGNRCVSKGWVSPYLLLSSFFLADGFSLSFVVFCAILSDSSSGGWRETASSNTWMDGSSRLEESLWEGTPWSPKHPERNIPSYLLAQFAPLCFILSWDPSPHFLLLARTLLVIHPLNDEQRPRRRRRRRRHLSCCLKFAACRSTQPGSLLLASLLYRWLVAWHPYCDYGDDGGRGIKWSNFLGDSPSGLCIPYNWTAWQSYRLQSQTCGLYSDDDEVGCRKPYQE